jgi:hypothetical protein
VIPEVEWEVLVSATETNNEVVLEGAKVMLSSIMVVDSRRGRLIVDVFPIHVVLEDERSLIIKLLQHRLKTCSSESSMDLC